MTLNTKAVRVGTAVVALALASTACDGGRSGNGQASPGRKGGNLVILQNSDFGHLDPQRTYGVTTQNFERLISRQLTTFAAEPGAAGTKLLPDLATDLGTPSDGAKTWTFHLKPGLKYEDGTAITAQDVKYGVERSFSPLIDSGPQYAKQFLVGGLAYKGPYGENPDLRSIEVPDASTIVFKLTSAHGDFGYTAALPTFTPVPKAKDTKVSYDLHPVSTGPYKIKTYNRGKSMTLDRNPNWSQSTDTVRKAYPDTVTVRMGLDPGVIDARLIASAREDADAIQLDTSVEPASVGKVLGVPAVKKRSVTGSSDSLGYIAMNTTKGPLKNVKVRQALEYAIDKTAQQTARGGKYAGDLATTIIAPTVQGYQKYDAYPTGPTGDPAKAKQMLSAAGYPAGFSATVETTTSDKGKAQAEAFQQSMAGVGVKITIAAVDQSVYFDAIGDIKKEPEFVFYGWSPNWPSPSTVIPPLFDGRQIVPTGNNNLSQLNDPTINAEIDRIGTLTDTDAANQAWGDLDEKLMTDFAPILPLLNDKLIFLSGSNVKGSYVHGFYGAPDLASLSVK